MKLNIYEKQKVVKTYETDAYSLPWGVVRDVTSAIDLDTIRTGSQEEIYSAIGLLLVNNADTIDDLVKDIFDGLTDEELRNASTSEVIECLLDVVIYTINSIMRGNGSKNRMSRTTGQ